VSDHEIRHAERVAASDPSLKPEFWRLHRRAYGVPPFPEGAGALEGGDWDEVFKYAAFGVVAVTPVDKTPVEPFTRQDVRFVYASVEGEKDGPEWVALVELRDGRFAVVKAWCDYTGWG
jgi:hypothetical protein